MATTVLDLVQKTLSDMDSDAVNSIGDTIESQQIAQLVKEVYDNIMTEQDVADNYGLYPLDGLADTTKPTIMKVPDNVISLELLRYDTAGVGATDPAFATITYKEPGDFLNTAYQLRPSDGNTQTITWNNVKYYVYTNQAPRFWTMFDDTYVHFDAFLSSVENTMHSQKSSCWGQMTQDLILADNTIIDIPVAQMQQLKAEIRELAFDLWKDGASPKVNQIARRTRVRNQRLRQRIRIDQEAVDDTGPNYGRVGARRVGNLKRFR